MKIYSLHQKNSETLKHKKLKKRKMEVLLDGSIGPQTKQKIMQYTENI